MSKVKLCKYCKKHGTFRESKGYTNEWADDVYVCPDCKHPLIDIDYPSKDFDIIRFISYDPAFIESMIDLRKRDIVEYNLKLSQFKTQVYQQKQAKQDTKPHCPHCNSTNISKIGAGERAASIAVLGVFSKKINKSFKCKDCGYTW